MRTSSYSQSEINIKGSVEEIKALHKMLSGLGFVGCGRDGVPLYISKVEDCKVTPDPVCSNHFVPWVHEEIQYDLLSHEQLQRCTQDLDKKGSMFSIYVEGLCGYNYTPERYEELSKFMTDSGFVCLRSPRDDEGQYWEKWYLPGTWSVKGHLKDYLSAYDGRRKFEKIAEWLKLYVTPGSISFVHQAFGLSAD